MVILESPCDPNFNLDDSHEDNDSIASAAPIGPGAHANLYTSDTDPDFYEVLIPAYTNLNISFAGIPSAHRATAYDANGVVLARGYNGLYYRAQSPVPLTVYVGIAMNSGYDTGDSCGYYDMTVQFPPSPTEYASFCIPTQGSSVGTAAHLYAWRNAPQYGEELVLTCYNAPPGQFGYYLVGTQSASPGIPLGQGRLCLAGSLGRYNVAGTNMNSAGVFDSGGSFENGVGTGYFGHGFIFIA